MLTLGFKTLFFSPNNVSIGKVLGCFSYMYGETVTWNSNLQPAVYTLHWLNAYSDNVEWGCYIIL